MGYSKHPLCPQQRGHADFTASVLFSGQLLYQSLFRHQQSRCKRVGIHLFRLFTPKSTDVWNGIRPIIKVIQFVCHSEMLSSNIVIAVDKHKSVISSRPDRQSAQPFRQRAKQRQYPQLCQYGFYVNRAIKVCVDIVDTEVFGVPFNGRNA